MGKNGTGRTRNWTTIIYPPTGAEGERTECPENWAEIISNLAVKAVVSPLHDKDIKEDGEYKKPHRHVVFVYDGVKDEAQARKDFKMIGGVGCEPVRSLYTMTRYLTHKDNPEKAQYSNMDILTFGGFEYKKYVETKEDEDRQIASDMGEIVKLCWEQGIHEFADVTDYLLQERPELFSTFRKNSYFFSCYLKSKLNITKQMGTQETKL